MGLCRVVVILHFHANTRALQPAFFQARSKVLHRVDFSRLNVVIPVTDDVLVAHPAGAPSTKHIHVPTPPDWRTICGHNDSLVHIKRPAIIPRQPCLVRWVCDENRIKPRLCHCCAGFGEAGFILCNCEGCFALRHLNPLS